MTSGRVHGVLLDRLAAHACVDRLQACADKQHRGSLGSVGKPGSAFYTPDHVPRSVHRHLFACPNYCACSHCDLSTHCDFSASAIPRYYPTTACTDLSVADAMSTETATLLVFVLTLNNLMYPQGTLTHLSFYLHQRNGS